MDKLEAAGRKFCELRGLDPEEWIVFTTPTGAEVRAPRHQKYAWEAMERYRWQEALKYGEEMDEPGNFGPTITVNRADYHRMREQNGLMRKEIVELQKYHRETFDRLQDQLQKVKDALVKSEDACKYHAKNASELGKKLEATEHDYASAVEKMERYAKLADEANQKVAALSDWEHECHLHYAKLADEANQKVETLTVMLEFVLSIPNLSDSDLAKAIEMLKQVKKNG